jgi:hypothetical protein
MNFLFVKKSLMLPPTCFGSRRLPRSTNDNGPVWAETWRMWYLGTVWQIKIVFLVNCWRLFKANLLSVHFIFRYTQRIDIKLATLLLGNENKFKTWNFRGGLSNSARGMSLCPRLATLHVTGLYDWPIWRPRRIWVKDSHEVSTDCFRIGSEYRQKNVLDSYGFDKL